MELLVYVMGIIISDPRVSFKTNAFIFHILSAPYSIQILLNYLMHV